ncbi:RNA-binding S4 domain-containing protein [Vibrio sp. DNF-1]|nr:RNA-binding S4 domain-containing protein [Vibrio salinus]MCE0495631.1 RNA-binding S4 domain-containing protein [Vibrio salinus]
MQDDNSHENSADEIEIEAIGIEVDSQPIELYKVLKIANAVSGGGEAKYAISEGYVAVNGEIELRKRRKIYDGDLIEFNQEFYLLICDNPVAERPVSREKEILPKSEKPLGEVKNKKNSRENRAEIKFF